MNQSPEEVRSEIEAAMPKRVAQLYWLLRNRVADLHFAWKSLLRLYGEDQETVDVLNRCSGSFAGRLQTVLSNHVFLGLSCLKDPARHGERENAVFALVIDEAQKNGSCDLAKRLKERLLEFKKLCEAITLHRNRRIAHSDLDVALHIGEGDLPDVSRRDVEAVLAAARAFMHVVEVEYLGSQTAYELGVDSRGAEHLVFWLRQGLEHEKCKKTKRERRKGV